jgi:hypothetical protein
MVVGGTMNGDDEERVMIPQELSSSDTRYSDLEFSIWNSLDQVFPKRAPRINSRASSC